MARVDETYKGGNFLVTDDLEGKLFHGIISETELQEVGGVNKIILHFENQEKVYPCNQTNAKTLAKIFNSEESDDWVGREVVLRPDVTQWQGRQVGCIRIDIVAMGENTAIFAEPELTEDTESADAAAV